MIKKINLKKQGFGIIEILIAISLSAVILTAFLGLTLHTVKINRANIKELRARMYLKELVEITKDLEQSNWKLIANCSLPCYPVASTTFWDIKQNEKQSLENGDYLRWLKIIDVDQDTKKVIAKIEWHDGFKERESTLETYIYNYDFSE